MKPAGVNGTPVFNGTGTTAVIDAALGNVTIWVQLIGLDDMPISPNTTDVVQLAILPLPTLTINSPANGTTVTPPFNITVTLTNFQVNGTGTALTPGQGRIRVTIDGTLLGSFNSTTIPIQTLSQGSHNITLQLRNLDQTPIVPDISRTIRVTVGDGGNGGEGNITVTFGPVRFEGEPIGDATVRLSFEGTSREARTGTNGIATLTVPASWRNETISYRVTADGYKTLEGEGTIGSNGVFQAEDALDLEEEGDGNGDDDAWIIILIIAIIAIIVIIAILVFVFSRRSEEEERVETVGMAETEEDRRIHMGEEEPETEEEHEEHMADEAE